MKRTLLLVAALYVTTLPASVVDQVGDGRGNIYVYVDGSPKTLNASRLTAIDKYLCPSQAFDPVNAQLTGSRYACKKVATLAASQIFTEAFLKTIERTCVTYQLSPFAGEHGEEADSTMLALVIAMESGFDLEGRALTPFNVRPNSCSSEYLREFVEMAR